MNDATHAGLTPSLEFRPVFRRLADDEGGGWLVEFPDLPGCTADGETLEEALAEGRDAVAAWIETARAEDREVPVPATDAAHSGKWVQRLPRSLHGRLADRAREEGVSLNTLVATMLAEGLGVRSAPAGEPIKKAGPPASRGR